MNTSVLKTLGFWLNAITTIGGLLISQGVILHGTTPDVVIGYLLSIAGLLGGHALAANALGAATTPVVTTTVPPAAPSDPTTPPAA